MKNKKVWIAIAALALAMIAMDCVLAFAQPTLQQGSKTIVVEVIHKDATTKEFTYQTDETYLGDVLIEEGLIVGEESELGLFVTQVDGELADYNVDKGWWQLSKDGVIAQTGVSDTPIADGDHFEWTYTIG